MVLLDATAKILQNDRSKELALKKELLNYLKKLRDLESKFWGVTVNRLASGEEEVLESTNHVIHLLMKNEDRELEAVLALREVKEFLRDIESLHAEVLYLKKQIKESNKLRDYISKYTIRLVDQRNYMKMKNIFILEKQLYDVLDIQDKEFQFIIKEIRMIKFSSNTDKTKFFLEKLVKARDVLAGHMDHHGLWEEERQGYSNVSNILTALIKEVSSD